MMNPVPPSGSNRQDEFRAWLDAEWRKAIVEYQQHGSPFGTSSHSLALWVEFGRITTAN